MLTAVLLFGAAFGYLEASVVSYLRLLHEPARLRFYPNRAPADLFPLLTLEQIKQVGPEQMQLLPIEIGREAATLLMLAGIALAASQTPSEWAALFVIAFGIWDITFYVFLKVLLDWPSSLFTWDILFLIPVPWAGPVLAPVLVSVAMIAGGIWHLVSGAQPWSARQWALLLTGALVIVISFAMDYRNVMNAGMPRPFHWEIFALGMAIGIGAIWRRA